MIKKMKKNKKVYIALAIPFLVILMFLVKIYHTIYSGQDSFIKRGGEVFLEEIFMQDFETKVPITKAIYAAVIVRKQTEILKKIDEQKQKHKNQPRYHWLAIAIKDIKEQYWKVTYRENHVVPKLICESRVAIKTGKATPLDCYYSHNSQKKASQFGRPRD